MKKAPLVAIIMGSDSDYETMNEAYKVLNDFGVSVTMEVMSAHRSPHVVATFAEKARAKGIKVIIAGAGGAAHLAGVVAAHTTLPVIGVPIQTSALGGLDSLLSTVQMPGGVSVATVGIGKSGAFNAGIMAVQILALSSKVLEKKMVAKKRTLAASVKTRNARLQKLIGA